MLEIAKENAGTLGVAERIDWLESDLFAALAPSQKWDVIVSNPPYVADREFESLPREVRDHEPRTALIAGPKGTEVIERLIADSADRLPAGGWLLIEISPMIAEAVTTLFDADSRWEKSSRLRDLAGHDRVIEAQRKN